MAPLFARFCRCERGATSIEYGLLIAILSIVIVGSSGSIRSALQSTYTSVNNSIATAE